MAHEQVTIEQARDFFRSPAFRHGLVVLGSLDSAIEQVELAKQFYIPELFCGSLRQLKPVKHDSRTNPYSVCLRVHRGGVHGWERDLDNHQSGQSLRGWKMARDFVAALSDRDAALALNLTPDWSQFQW